MGTSERTANKIWRLKNLSVCRYLVDCYKHLTDELQTFCKYPLSVCHSPFILCHIAKHMNTIT